MTPFELPLQPGEVNAEAHRQGRGPVSDLRDGRLHPAVEAQRVEEVTHVVASTAVASTTEFAAVHRSHAIDPAVVLNELTRRW